MHWIDLSLQHRKRRQRKSGPVIPGTGSQSEPIVFSAQADQGPLIAAGGTRTGASLGLPVCVCVCVCVCVSNYAVERYQMDAQVPCGRNQRAQRHEDQEARSPLPGAPGGSALRGRLSHVPFSWNGQESACRAGSDAPLGCLTWDRVRGIARL